MLWFYKVQNKLIWKPILNILVAVFWLNTNSHVVCFWQFVCVVWGQSLNWDPEVRCLYRWVWVFKIVYEDLRKLWFVPGIVPKQLWKTVTLVANIMNWKVRPASYSLTTIIKIMDLLWSGALVECGGAEATCCAELVLDELDVLLSSVCACIRVCDCVSRCESLCIMCVCVCSVCVISRVLRWSTESTKNKSWRYSVASLVVLLLQQSAARLRD